MKLLSYEHKLLCNFINSSIEERKQILDSAINNPKTSGILVYYYKLLINC